MISVAVWIFWVIYRTTFTVEIEEESSYTFKNPDRISVGFKPPLANNFITAQHSSCNWFKRLVGIVYNFTMCVAPIRRGGIILLQKTITVQHKSFIKHWRVPTVHKILIRASFDLKREGQRYVYGRKIFSIRPIKYLAAILGRMSSTLKN